MSNNDNITNDDSQKINESKRRKTTQNEIMNNYNAKSNSITLNLSDVDNLNDDLDIKNNYLNYAFNNSVKKRRLDQIDNVNLSRIPNPAKDYKYNNMKYIEFESKIPKIV